MKKNKDDLNVKFWSYPEEMIHYLDKGIFNLEITNNCSSQIEIKKITVKLNTEEGFGAYKIHFKGPKITIKPRQISSRIEIPFSADLSLTEHTNASGLEITYQKKDKQVKTEYPTYHYLLLKPIRPVKEHFFISHKDPEDTDIAKKFDRYLQKIGFKGFIAEIEKRPGTDIWKNKIFPGIDTCIALIVLWTENAKKLPQNILKEMKHAKKQKKKIILISQKGINLPKSFPKYTEFIEIEKFSENVFSSTVQFIEETYKNGLYSEEIPHN